MMKQILFSAAFLLAFIPAAAFAQEQTVVDFTGELVDQNAAPISGVLPLEFRVFADEKSKKAIAVENHFVAVVDGAYAIALGENSDIRTAKSELYVAVYLDGKELIRQKVKPQKQIVAQNPKTVKTDTAGSQKKDDFKLECPAGYVVTGIEGSVKDIKSLRAICSKTI